MSTPELLLADGDPPEEPEAAHQAPVEHARAEDAGASPTEHPLPESFPSGGASS